MQNNSCTEKLKSSRSYINLDLHFRTITFMYRYKIKYLLIFFLLQQSYGYILESRGHGYAVLPWRHWKNVHMTDSVWKIKVSFLKRYFKRVVGFDHVTDCISIVYVLKWYLIKCHTHPPPTPPRLWKDYSSFLGIWDENREKITIHQKVNK